MCGGVKVYLHASNLSRFVCREKGSQCPLVEPWMGPTSGLDAVTETNVSTPVWNRTLIFQPVT